MFILKCFCLFMLVIYGLVIFNMLWAFWKTKRQSREAVICIVDEPGILILKVSGDHDMAGATKYLREAAIGTQWSVNDEHYGREHLTQGPIYYAVIDSRKYLFSHGRDYDGYCFDINDKRCEHVEHIIKSYIGETD